MRQLTNKITEVCMKQDSEIEDEIERLDEQHRAHATIYQNSTVSGDLLMDMMNKSESAKAFEYAAAKRALEWIMGDRDRPSDMYDFDCPECGERIETNTLEHAQDCEALD